MILLFFFILKWPRLGKIGTSAYLIGDCAQGEKSRKNLCGRISILAEVHTCTAQIYNNCEVKSKLLSKMLHIILNSNIKINVMLKCF